MTDYFNKYQKIGFLWAVMIVFRHALNYAKYTLAAESVVYWSERFVYELTGLATVSFAIFAGYNFFQNYKPERWKNKLLSRVRALVIPYGIAIAVNWCFFAVRPHVPGINRVLTSSFYEMTFRSFCHTLLSGCGLPLWFMRNFPFCVLHRRNDRNSQKNFN